MVEIVTPENRSLYQHLFEDMYAMRYRLFVDHLGWEIPGIEANRDKDLFDKDDTVYLLALSQDRKQIVGSTRLNPTTEPHMLTEVFPHYCDLEDIPQSPDVWECSRYAIDRSACASRDHFTDIRQQLGLGLTEYIMSIGATHISWLTHQNFYNHTISVMDTVPLGVPREEPADNAIYIAGLSHLGPQTWRRQRKLLRNPIRDLTEFRTGDARTFLTPDLGDDTPRRVA